MKTKAKTNTAGEKRNTCRKCNGKGSLKGFSHVDGGRCWGCMGFGTVPNRAMKARLAIESAEHNVEEKLGELAQATRSAEECIARQPEDKRAKRRVSIEKRLVVYRERVEYALGVLAELRSK